MYKLKLLLLLLFLSCSNKKTFEKQIRISPKTVEYDHGHMSTFTLKKYYFHGTDSANLILQKITSFYTKNQIATESELITTSETQKGWKSFYDYKDSLLVQKRTVDAKKDSTKILYWYNDKNQVVKREHYTFRKRLRQAFIQKSRNLNSSIITEEDFEQNRTWDKISEIKFSYDSLGRKTEYYAPDLHWGNQNKYRWFYDKVGNMIKKESWSHDELIWTEHYSYKNNEYSYVRTWHDRAYQKDLKYIVYTNDAGAKTKTLTMRNGIIQNKSTFEYDEHGLLKKETVFGANDEVLITYIIKME